MFRTVFILLLSLNILGLLASVRAADLPPAPAKAVEIQVEAEAAESTRASLTGISAHRSR